VVIPVEPELAAALAEAAGAGGTTPEALAQAALRRQFLPDPALVPRDEWERRLLGAAVHCGVSLPNEAFLGEALYD
jgi:hypothetical protein